MTPPLHLTLIRHANTDWNSAGRWQGFSDIELSGLGAQQARALGRRLQGERFDAAYASDMQRTQQTAHYALAHATCPPLTLDPRLREFNFGDFEGGTEAQNRLHAGWVGWQADPWRTAVPGGESLSLLTDRAAQWANELGGGDLAGKRVVAFSHGLTIRALLWRLLGWPTVTPQADWPSPFPMNVRLPHASVTRLLRAPHGWELLTLGDAGHLEEWSGLMADSGV